MALSVATNVPSLTAQNNLNRSQSRLATSLERLSTGLKINKAQDDASGLVITELQRAQINGLDQASQNIDRSITLTQTAESGLAEINSLLLDLRELAVDGANEVIHDGTASNGSNGANQAEVNNLLATITRIADTTKFGTVNVLDGSVSAANYQIGAFCGESTTLSITDSDSAALGVSNAVVTSHASASAAILSIDAAITAVSNLRGEIGAFQKNTLRAVQSNISSQVTNLREAHSLNRDTDFTSEITAFTNEQIRQQAATSVLGLANQSSQSILSLLQ